MRLFPYIRQRLDKTNKTNLTCWRWDEHKAFIGSYYKKTRSTNQHKNTKHVTNKALGCRKLIHTWNITTATKQQQPAGPLNGIHITSFLNADTSRALQENGTWLRVRHLSFFPRLKAKPWRKFRGGIMRNSISHATFANFGLKNIQ